MSKIIYLEDGDDLSIIVKLNPSASDPSGQFPGIAMTYRVIANAYGPTLKIVPHADTPRLLTEVPKQ